MLAARSFFPLLLLAMALPAAPGCVLTNDFDKYSFGDAGVRGDGGPRFPQDCVEGFVEISVPSAGATTGASDDFTSTCGGAGSGDLAWEFVAPRDDYYRFNTVGSDFDTVLSLREATCAGSELDCSDNFEMAPTSEIVRRLTADETVIAVVDGNADFGNVVLNAEFVTCPSLNLDEITLPVNHTTVGQSDDNAGACGGAGQGDRAYRFTAPNDGFYRFEVLADSLSFVSALYLEDGPECGGVLLQCNSGRDRRSHVGRQLTAGQVVTVRVDGDGGQGAYGLTVNELTSVTSCVDGVLGDGDFTLTEADPHRMSTSCGDTASWHLDNTSPANIRDFPDLILSFTNLDPPAPGCSFGCTVDITAEFPFNASITDGDSCQGAEQGCISDLTPNFGDSPWTYTGSISYPSADGRDKVLVIDRVIPDFDGIPMGSDHGDNVNIQIGCAGIC